MNSWTNGYYHDTKGKILGNVIVYNDIYKALLNNIFLGWFISEEYARTAVESAYSDSLRG